MVGSIRDANRGPRAPLAALIPLLHRAPSRGIRRTGRLCIVGLRAYDRRLQEFLTAERISVNNFLTFGRSQWRIWGGGQGAMSPPFRCGMKICQAWSGV